MLMIKNSINAFHSTMKFGVKFVFPHPQHSYSFAIPLVICFCFLTGIGCGTAVQGQMVDIWLQVGCVHLGCPE